MFLVCWHGFLWGTVAYGLHFVWFYILLRDKSSVGVLFSFLFYFIIVLYSAFTSALWFLSISFLRRVFGLVLSFFICSIIYFFLLEKYMFWFLDSGYPFINPLILLMRYEWFAIVFSWSLGILGVTDSYQKPVFYHLPDEKEVVIDNNLFVYLDPCKNKKSSIDSAQEICLSLQKLSLREKPKEKQEKKSKKYKQIFVVGPETCFPFACDEHREFVDLWSSILPDNAHLMFGAARFTYGRQKNRKKIKDWKKKRYQTIYWIHRGLIMQTYDKTHRVGFTEKLPRFWKRYEWVRSMFSDYGPFMSKGKNKKNTFSVSPGSSSVSIRPILCSELFFTSKSVLGQKQCVHLACVNDDWFCPYFRNLLLSTAKFKACFFGKTLLYVGHRG